MVRLDDRVRRIKEYYVEDGYYFVINRGRQYGKTTTLDALKSYLMDAYVVLSLDFQLMGTEDYKDEATFSRSFARSVLAALNRTDVDNLEKLIEPLQELMSSSHKYGLAELFTALSSMCANSLRPVVLMIDEVDSASNNQVFIDFLAQLRGYYLKRNETPIFHSVILAGVYNIKNLKLKLRPEAEHQYNSLWNIAADFDIDMSFSTKQIAGMLEDYEADYHTGIDVQAVAEEIYEYTSGYPVLVSTICKYIDEGIFDKEEFENTGKPWYRFILWTKEGVVQAVKKILVTNAPLFESMIRHLDAYPEMKKMFQAILFQGSEFAYNPDTKEINLACMFGYAYNKKGKVQIANRIFETRLYNYFYSEEELSNTIVRMAKRDKSYFIQDNRLNMDIVMKRFVETFEDIYGQNNRSFIEDNGRKLFLLYLKPIINGTGNYYIEARTRDSRRTDVIVDYLGEQFIIELKIWHGNEYNERGEKQLTDYLDYYHQKKGYLISFNFNKSKEVGVKVIKVGDKTIVEAIV